MKKNLKKSFWRTLSIMFICLMLGCAAKKTIIQASAPVAVDMPSFTYYRNMKRIAGEGESEIVINRLKRFQGSIGGGMKIFVDGEERLKLKNGKSETIVVPDGEHTVCAGSRSQCNPEKKT
jgi:hypothetical protein